MHIKYSAEQISTNLFDKIWRELFLILLNKTKVKVEGAMLSSNF